MAASHGTEEAEEYVLSHSIGEPPEDVVAGLRARRHDNEEESVLTSDSASVRGDSTSDTDMEQVVLGFDESDEDAANHLDLIDAHYKHARLTAHRAGREAHRDSSSIVFSTDLSSVHGSDTGAAHDEFHPLSPGQAGEGGAVRADRHPRGRRARRRGRVRGQVYGDREGAGVRATAADPYDPVAEPMAMDDALASLGGFGKFQFWVNNALGYISFIDGLAVLSMVYVARRDPKTLEPWPGTIGAEWGLVGDKGWLIGAASSLFFLGYWIGAALFGFTSDRLGRKKALMLSMAVFCMGNALSYVCTTFDVYLVSKVVIGVGVAGQGSVNWVLTSEFWPPKARDVAGPLYQAYYTSGFITLALTMMALGSVSWRTLVLMTTLPLFVLALVWWLVPESPRWLLVQGRERESRGVLCRIARVNKRPMVPNRIISAAAVQSADTKDVAAPSPRGINADDYGSGGNPQPVPSAGADSPAADASSAIVVSGTAASNAAHVQSAGHSSAERGLGNASSSGPRANSNSGQGPVRGPPAREGIKGLVRHRIMRLRTLTSCYMWFACSLVYYGITFYGGSLGGNFHVNILLTAVVELPAYIIAIFLVKVGRRLAALLFFGTAAVVCLAALAQPPTWLQTILTLVGKFAGAGSFSTTYLYTTELFPTQVRNMGVGLSSQAARVGGVLAPMIVLIPGTAPLIMFGVGALAALLSDFRPMRNVVAAIAALLVRRLPETRGTILPETVQTLIDAEPGSATAAAGAPSA